MSEIGFVEELGEAFDRVFAIETRVVSGRRRRVWTRRRGALLLAAVLVGGCTATAAKLLSSSPIDYEMGRLVCNADNIPLPNGQGSGSRTILGPDESGQTPQLTCSGLLGVPVPELTACANPRAPRIFVYKPRRAGDTCQHQGLIPLPTSFRHAAAQVATLEHGLVTLQDSTACYRPAALVAAVQTLLDRIGFSGWSVRQETPSPMSASGPCGSTFISVPRLSARGTLARALSSHRILVVFHGQTIDVYRTASRQVVSRLLVANRRPLTSGVNGCASLPAAEHRATIALRRSGLTGPIRFGLATPPGDQAASRRCSTVYRMTTAPDGHTLLVTIWTPGAPRAPAQPDGFPLPLPLSDFHPASRTA